MAERSPEVNPYAPPKAELQGPAAVRAAPAAVMPPTPEQLRAALARLKEHVASPENLAADARAAGGLIRRGTLICLALFVLASLAAAGLAVKIGEDGNQSPLVFAGGAALVFGILMVVLVIADLALGRRQAPAPPDVALKRFLRALASGRDGYAWAALGPVARAQTVAAPRLGAVMTGEGQFSMLAPAGVKDYARSFARNGQKLMRTMRAKNTVLRSVDGDVAVVDTTLVFQSWPKWVTILFAVSAGAFRLGLLVAVVLFFVTRKRVELPVTKVMLQGQPGVWYLFDADVVAGRPPAGA